MLNYLCLVVFSRAINSNNAASYMSTAPLGYGMPIETKLKCSCVYQKTRLGVMLTYNRDNKNYDYTPESTPCVHVKHFLRIIRHDSPRSSFHALHVRTTDLRTCTRQILLIFPQLTSGQLYGYQIYHAYCQPNILLGL